MTAEPARGEAASRLFQLTDRECPSCYGTGDAYWSQGELEPYCLRCWGTGKIEVQRGPHIEAREVPDPAGTGKPGPTDPGWFQDWYGEGEVFIP